MPNVKHGNVKKKRFNERSIGPEFDELFRTVKIRVIYDDNTETEKAQTIPNRKNK